VRRAAHLAVHQHSPASAPRLTKQVPGELGRLPRALPTKHRSAARLAEYAAAHPLPRWEQYLQRARRGHGRRRALRFRPVKRCFRADATRRKHELREPPGAVRPDGRPLMRVSGHLRRLLQGRRT
jgi:hypothetical protein